MRSFSCHTLFQFIFRLRQPPEESTAPQPVLLADGLSMPTKAAFNTAFQREIQSHPAPRVRHQSLRAYPTRYSPFSTTTTMDMKAKELAYEQKRESASSMTRSAWVAQSPH